MTKQLSPFKSLRRGLAAGGVALLTGLLPLPAFAQVPLLDELLAGDSIVTPQADDDGCADDSGAAADPTQLVGSLVSQAAQMAGGGLPVAAPAPVSPLGSAPALLAAGAPMLAAGAPMLAAGAPMLGGVAPIAAPAPAPASPLAILSGAPGIDPTNLAPFMTGVPADLGSLPQAFQQQIVAVIQNAQQQHAAVAHRYQPGSPRIAHRQESIQSRAAQQVRALSVRAHRAMAALTRRNEAREARRARAARMASRPRVATRDQAGIGDLLSSLTSF